MHIFAYPILSELPFLETLFAIKNHDDSAQSIDCCIDCLFRTTTHQLHPLIADLCGSKFGNSAVTIVSDFVACAGHASLPSLEWSFAVGKNQLRTGGKKTPNCQLQNATHTPRKISN